MKGTDRQRLDGDRLDVVLRKLALSDELNATLACAHEANLRRTQGETARRQSQRSDRSPQIECNAAAARRCKHTGAIRSTHHRIIEHELWPVNAQPCTDVLELDRESCLLVQPALKLDAIAGCSRDGKLKRADQQTNE